MVSLEDLKQSKVWDTRYDLPTCPEINNPWIYMAYIQKLLRENKMGEIREEKILNYYSHCEVEEGLINRWPGGFGGKTSHDELIGACYLNERMAKEIVAYVVRNDGFYNNLGYFGRLTDNLYRFFWLLPYLKACANANPSPYEKLAWAIGCIADAFSIKQNDLGSKLKFWLMASVMKKYVICAPAIYFWKRRLKSKGIALQAMIEQELGQYPLIVELSKTVEL